MKSFLLWRGTDAIQSIRVPTAAAQQEHDTLFIKLMVIRVKFVAIRVKENLVPWNTHVHKKSAEKPSYCVSYLRFWNT